MDFSTNQITLQQQHEIRKRPGNDEKMPATIINEDSQEPQHTYNETAISLLKTLPSVTDL